MIRLFRQKNIIFWTFSDIQNQPYFNTKQYNFHRQYFVYFNFECGRNTIKQGVQVPGSMTGTEICVSLRGHSVGDMIRDASRATAAGADVSKYDSTTYMSIESKWTLL